MPNDNETPVDKVAIHMYKMGTGDCFVLKFMKGEDVTFKMLIDCGCYNRKFDQLRPFIRELKKDVGNQVDVLVVTHEHTDHVLGFQAGKTLLADQDNPFKAKQIWMAWTEKDEDQKVKDWQRDYGEKKMALGLVTKKLRRRVKSKTFRRQLLGTRDHQELLGHREDFVAVLRDFADLHGVGDYKGSLKGMAFVKDELAKADGTSVEYLEQGKIIENREGLEGVRIFVLGPPNVHEQVKQEHGEEGESFEHNKELEDSDLFVRALNAMAGPSLDPGLEPFAEDYSEAYSQADESSTIKQLYLQDDWRRIDDDWLFSAGQFALRMNSLTNNLSLVLAFEFKDSGKVMLFPGDAEFGSWNSWHKIDWTSQVEDLTTEKLLNRVVFYKVAHHLSHNGTARRQGLDMMTSSELAAMATLDYNVISSGWKSTMPNRLLMKELLEKTKGRTLVLNTDEIFYDLDNQVPLDDKIGEFREGMGPEEKEAFTEALNDESEFYTEYVLKV